jgi:putative flippase GtrA
MGIKPIRWGKFYMVGAFGWVVQTAALTLLIHGFGVNYLLATAIAVEAAVLHNFLWHRRWTWVDRREHCGLASSLLRFHLGNGLASIVGNLLFMRFFVGMLGWDPVPSNVISVALCSLINFVAADRFVFPSRAEIKLQQPADAD